MARVSSVRAAVGKIALVHWCDVINVIIATVTHLNIVVIMAAAAEVVEAYLPGDFTFVHCGMSTV